MEPQEVIPVRAAEIEPPTEREVGESPRPVDESIGWRSGAERRERRRRRRWRVGELERVAV